MDIITLNKDYDLAGMILHEISTLRDMGFQADTVILSDRAIKRLVSRGDRCLLFRVEGGSEMFGLDVVPALVDGPDDWFAVGCSVRVRSTEGAE